METRKELHKNFAARSAQSTKDKIRLHYLSGEITHFLPSSGINNVYLNNFARNVYSSRGAAIN